MAYEGRNDCFLVLWPRNEPRSVGADGAASAECDAARHGERSGGRVSGGAPGHAGAGGQSPGRHAAAERLVGRGDRGCNHLVRHCAIDGDGCTDDHPDYDLHPECDGPNCDVHHRYDLGIGQRPVGQRPGSLRYLCAGQCTKWASPDTDG